MQHIPIPTPQVGQGTEIVSSRVRFFLFIRSDWLSTPLQICSNLYKVRNTHEQNRKANQELRSLGAKSREVVFTETGFWADFHIPATPHIPAKAKAAAISVDANKQFPSISLRVASRWFIRVRGPFV
jgi:hypothetical protein